MATEHPGLAVHFVEGGVSQLRDWLHDGTCEIAVMYGGMGDETALETTDLYLVRPHVELALDHPRGPDEAGDHDRRVGPGQRAVPQRLIPQLCRLRAGNAVLRDL